jgi:diguanylate cyclase (GGDEF)-like protein
MNEEQPKSQNLVHVSTTDLALSPANLVSRGLELATQLAAHAAQRHSEKVDWRAVVCMNDERLLGITCAQLTMHGYRTVQARNSAEMLALSKRENFHLMATDSGTDTLAIAEQIQQDDPTIPVITTRLIGESVFFRPVGFEKWPYDHPLALLPRTSGTAPINVEMLKHLISCGNNLFNDGVWDVAEWSKRVLDDTGEWARPYVATIHDEISKTSHNFDQMRKVLYCDALTWTHNRFFFEMRLVEELERARRFNGRMALISADVDFFKSLNDVFGHDKGNEVLRTVSAILKQQVRKMDLVCRYSDDDFLVIVPETNADSTVRVAEKLRREIETHSFPGIPRGVTISCGVAEYLIHGTTRDELVYAADAALALAKSCGRNRVALATKTSSM